MKSICSFVLVFLIVIVSLVNVTYAELVPLELYWGKERGDNFTTATKEGAQAAINAGYKYVRIEGYVFPSKMDNTVPLKLFWGRERGDNFTTATKEGAQAAINAGYKYVRIEGYVYPAKYCQ